MVKQNGILPDDILCSVRNLRVQFKTDEGIVTALDDVSFAIPQGKTLGLCGESGSGKSVSTKAMMQLLPKNAIIDPKTEILFRKRDGSVIDIAKLSPRSNEIREVRGGEIGMIFQEPMASFSPVYTIGNQMSETIRLHRRFIDGQTIGSQIAKTAQTSAKLSEKQARELGIEMLDKVGLSNASLRFDQYPHELSGGMRQRAMIAMALSTHPLLLIADEPTTALDVTIQSQILDLMQELQDELEMSIILITHDIGVIAQVANDIAVMYLGRIIEYGDMEYVVFDHKNLYTQGLIVAITSLDNLDERLKAVTGDMPGPFNRPSGCSFNNRCKHKIDGLCSSVVPQHISVGDNHVVRCHLFESETNNGQ